MKKQELIIIGAGASGLMAAKELATSFELTLLEARDRVGGRIHSIRPDKDIIEAGASFIHGKPSVTLGLLKKAHIKYVPMEGCMYRSENGLFIVEEDMINGWDELLKKMKKIKEDISLDEFLNENYSGRYNEKFRQRVIAYAEGFDLADTSLASTKSLEQEWSNTSDDAFLIPGGYRQLTDYLYEDALSENCTIILSQVVKQINWKKDDIRITTRDNKTYQANKLLITLPPGIFRQDNAQSSITFKPAIDSYIKAFSNIGFGDVIKIIIKFGRCLWKPDTGFILSDQQFFPTWWTQLPDDSPTLTGWSGGPTAATLFRENKETIMQKALTSLSAILNIPVAEIKKEIIHSELFNWRSDEFALGSYSYDTIYSADAKKILNEGIDGCIFFAGEGLYSGKHPGTVEAALVSGKEVAKKIKKAL